MNKVFTKTQLQQIDFFLNNELKSIQKQIRENFQPTKDKKVEVAVRAERRPPPRPKPSDKTKDRRPVTKR